MARKLQPGQPVTFALADGHCTITRGAIGGYVVQHHAGATDVVSCQLTAFDRGEGYSTRAAVAAGCDRGGHDFDATGRCEDCGFER